MVLENRNGLIMRSISVNGQTIKPMARENLFMLMVMCTKEIGPMIKQMEQVHICMLTAHYIKDNGKMTYSMVMVLRLGPMEANILASMLTVARMGLVVICGLIKAIIVESGRTTRLMGWAAMFGLTNVGIKVNGLTTIWMGWVSIFGPMAAFMRASIQKIKSRVSVCTLGLMVVDTKETGTVANNMVWVPIGVVIVEK